MKQKLNESKIRKLVRKIGSLTDYYEIADVIVELRKIKKIYKGDFVAFVGGLPKWEECAEKIGPLVVENFFKTTPETEKARIYLRKKLEELE